MAEVPEQFEPESRAQWRKWLAKHHANSSGVWLVYRKGADRNLTYADAVEEALCFGWVDSRPNKIDALRYMQLFSPRKPGSAWSAINKRRVEDLIARHLMQPPGLAKVEAAKRDGSWKALDSIDALTMPPDLTKALHANAEARANFNEFPPSSKKIILSWIAAAKRPETRAQRITETVTKAADNIRANHWRP